VRKVNACAATSVGMEPGGMSLLELIVAMMLLSFVALSVTPMLMLGAVTSAVAQDATELSIAASDQLELLAALPFTDTALVAGGDTDFLSVANLPPFTPRVYTVRVSDWRRE